MKDILENAEVFECYAIIDACYWELKALFKETGKPKNVLESLIDKATGFSEKHIDKAIELIRLIQKQQKNPALLEK